MKKYISVFSLFVRSSLYKLLPVFLIAGLTQIYLFTAKLENLRQWDGTFLGIEPIITEAKIQIPFIVAFLVISVILMFFGTESDSKLGYTLRRLRVTEKQVFLIQTAYNFFVYVLFMIFELLVAFFMFVFYFHEAEKINIAHPGFFNNQTVFLAFYRSEFLHALIPMQDITRIIRNIIYLSGTAFSIATIPYFQRRKKTPFEAPILVIFIALSFFAEWKEIELEIFCLFVSLFLIAVSVFRIKGKGAAYEN